MPPLLLPQATGTFVLPGEENGSARKKRKCVRVAPLELSGLCGGGLCSATASDSK